MKNDEISLFLFKLHNDFFENIILASISFNETTNIDNITHHKFDNNTVTVESTDGQGQLL